MSNAIDGVSAAAAAAAESGVLVLAHAGEDTAGGEDHEAAAAAASRQLVRDIHVLIPPSATAGGFDAQRRDQSWGSSTAAASHRPSSTLSEITSENFGTMSREFNALVLAGSNMQAAAAGGAESHHHQQQLLGRIGEADGGVQHVEENPQLALVPNSYAGVVDHLQMIRVLSSPPAPAADIDDIPLMVPPAPAPTTMAEVAPAEPEEVALHRVKKEEVESKISAWATAEMARINNRLKRQEVVIGNWEREQGDKARNRYNKVQRKLEERKARAVEKMENEVAKARQKAEEKRASAEAKRGTKAARVVELSNLMKALGRRPPPRASSSPKCCSF